MRKIVLVDLDHTVCNSFWRDDMIAGSRVSGEWDEYHRSGCDDTPIFDIIGLLNALHEAEYEIVAITARPEKWRKQSMEWLLKYDVKIDELLMRPEDAFRPAPLIKLDLVKERFGDSFKNEIAFMLEDRDDVVAAFRAEGITVLQCFGRQD